MRYHDKMKALATQESALISVTNAGNRIDKSLRAHIEKRRTVTTEKLCDMSLYGLGMLAPDFTFLPLGKGKRLRPSLCLYVANAYSRDHRALDAAVAIEMFHNFTLVHDDVEDHDETRRNQPTLWKLCGINHAINTGDYLSLIATEIATQCPPMVSSRLLSAFSEVIEGQYLDFESAEFFDINSEQNEKTYFEMLTKKTGALFSISCEAAGLITEQSREECALLREYGRNLGIAYQLFDDYRSIWGSIKSTGKDAQSDIREKKKTLAVIRALKNRIHRDRLVELYSLGRPLQHKEVLEVLALFQKANVEIEILNEIHKYVLLAHSAVGRLSVGKEIIATLQNLLLELMPNIPPSHNKKITRQESGLGGEEKASVH